MEFNMLLKYINTGNKMSCQDFSIYLLMFVVFLPRVSMAEISSNYYRKMIISKESFDGNILSNVQDVR